MTRGVKGGTPYTAEEKKRLTSLRDQARAAANSFIFNVYKDEWHEVYNKELERRGIAGWQLDQRRVLRDNTGTGEVDGGPSERSAL